MFTPTIVKVLQCLRGDKSGKTRTEIASIIKEKPEYVNSSLDKLVALGVVAEAEGFYSYLPVSRNEDFYNSIIEIYHKVNKRPAIELLVRGLMCEIPSHYLVHANTVVEILQNYGLEKKDVNELLEREIENGYLRRIKVVCLGIRPVSIPVYVPSYYLSHLRILGWEQYDSLKQPDKSTEFHEEDYLMGYYPPELACPAQEYMDKQGRELKNRLRERGVITWLEKIR